MQEERYIELLVQLHEGMPRLGPGNTPSTLRALALCEGLPEAPKILDVGCGTGAQTFVLAEKLQRAMLTATDLFPSFLAKLQADAFDHGVSKRVKTVVADMNELPFDGESFDLVWSEGAAYIMGFDQALTQWQLLLRPGGFLVVSELSWFSPDPPQHLRQYWQEQYPGMRSIGENLAAAERLGWTTIESFQLPAEAWTVDYYGPMQQRLPTFRSDNADDPEAQEVAAMTEQEISTQLPHLDDCGYAFYVLQRPA